MHLGRKILNLRLDRDLEQQELARRCNVTPGAISKIESGVNSPSGELLWRIARALLVPVEYLLAERFPYPYEPPEDPRDVAARRPAAARGKTRVEITREEKAWLDALRACPKDVRALAYELPTLPLHLIAVLHAVVLRELLDKDSAAALVEELLQALATSGSPQEERSHGTRRRTVPA